MDELKKKELKHRVEAKRKDLEANIAKLKADASGSGSDALDASRRKLSDLNDAVKDGWDNMSNAAAEKVNALLRD